MRNENPSELENVLSESGEDKKPKQVGRGALEMRLMGLISRHPKGMSAPPLVNAAINMGSNEKSAKQCLRRLVKVGKLQRTHRGWKIPQEAQIGAGKTLPSSASKKPSKKPVAQELSQSPSESTERDLELAVALLEIETLSKERQDRVRYLASLLVSKKIRVF